MHRGNSTSASRHGEQVVSSQKKGKSGIKAQGLNQTVYSNQGGGLIEESTMQRGSQLAMSSSLLVGGASQGNSNQPKQGLKSGANLSDLLQHRSLKAVLPQS